MRRIVLPFVFLLAACASEPQPICTCTPTIVVPPNAPQVESKVVKKRKNVRDLNNARKSLDALDRKLIPKDDQDSQQ